jgi:hypothetical protein
LLGKYLRTSIKIILLPFSTGAFISGQIRHPTGNIGQNRAFEAQNYGAGSLIKVLNS